MTEMPWRDEVSAQRERGAVFSAQGEDMTLCPIDLALHCTGCPICPATRKSEGPIPTTVS